MEHTSQPLPDAEAPGAPHSGVDEIAVTVAGLRPASQPPLGDSQLPPPRPRAPQSTHPTASAYAVELPYAEELQAMLDGKYTVEGFLGRGGMGAVYRGLQLPLKRPV